MKTAYAAYEKAHKLPDHVRKAARALMRCRTVQLGGHMQVCPEGHYERHWYNSCKHRICPQCNWLQIEQWLAKQNERLIKCAHYHMIFTPPHELNDLRILNVRLMTNLLFTAVRDTLYEFFFDERHIGGKPGIIATLHTWSQTLILHPHVHCLITEGGLKDGQWVSTRKKGYLFPVRAVMPVFRGKLLAYIDKAAEKGELALPEGMTLQRWRNLKNKLGRVKWNVHIRERYDYGKGVLIYLARYIRGGAISNKRIVSLTDKGVTFRHRASDASKQTCMTLPEPAFIQRYLLHVPEPHMKVVRSYGLYASTSKDELLHCRLLFGQDAVRDIEIADWQDYCETKAEEHPELCPVCGRRLIRAAEIPPMRDYLRPSNREAIPKAA
ncbi:MAG: IS91 family transposase [Nitrospirota bacterium]